MEQASPRESDRERFKSSSVFAIIVVVFTLYSAIFIFRTSVVIDGMRYFTLADDVMISMRYAKNLANEHGLVWNPGGERVEGYTNPLWVVYLATFHLLAIPESKIGLFVAMGGWAFLLANLFMVRGITESLTGHGNRMGLAGPCAVALTAFYLPLDYWSLYGFEVGALAFLMSLTVYLVLRSHGKPGSRLYLYIPFGIGTLIRIDFAVPFLVLLVYLVWQRKQRRRGNALFALSFLLILIAAQTGLRYWYYHDVLPNTYYLKMTGYPLGLRLIRGLFVFLRFLWNSHLIPVLGVVPVFWKRYRPGIWLPVFLMAGQATYSIYVGGDAWEYLCTCNRYLAVSIPLLFVLIGLAVWDVSGWISRIRVRVPAAVVGVVMTLLLMVGLNVSRPAQDFKDWLLIKDPFQFASHKAKVQLGFDLERITLPGAKIAEVWAGTIPYFIDGRVYIDLLGRNDRTVARGKMCTFESSGRCFRPNDFAKSPYTFFYPGHLKWNYPYSIGELKPDIIVGLWGDVREAIPLLVQSYTPVYFGLDRTCLVRRDSDKIRRDMLPAGFGRSGAFPSRSGRN